MKRPVAPEQGGGDAGREDPLDNPFCRPHFIPRAVRGEPGSIPR
jgi:hypothetical protein